MTKKIRKFIEKGDVFSTNHEEVRYTVDRAEQGSTRDDKPAVVIIATVECKDRYPIYPSEGDYLYLRRLRSGKANVGKWAIHSIFPANTTDDKPAYGLVLSQEGAWEVNESSQAI
jgi:hypothetical protein